MQNSLSPITTKVNVYKYNYPFDYYAFLAHKVIFFYITQQFLTQVQIETINKSSKNKSNFNKYEVIILVGYHYGIYRTF